MRIQHNVMAMNAYRNYGANTHSLSQNLERLSSGYRINRAGDDAAGLAISEKMRAQITGLSAAQKNVKDGVSLVKTAEGAMQEIQDMLNRMDYLATQSANGTYQDAVDRENLQAEVERLKEEIDRIADSANFNRIQLLDGSFARKSLTESTLRAAELTSVSSRSTGAGAATAAYRNLTNALSLGRATSAVPAKPTIFSSTLSDVSGSAGEYMEVTLGSDTFRLLFSASPTAANELQADTTITGADLAKKIVEISGAAKTINGQAFTLSATGNTLKLEQDDLPKTNADIVPNNYNFTVKVVRREPKMDGQANTTIAFGAQAKVEPSPYCPGGIAVVQMRGTIDINQLSNQAIVNFMRANGIQGATDSTPSVNIVDQFYLHWVNGSYYIKLTESKNPDGSNATIGSAATVTLTDLNGNPVTSPRDEGIPGPDQIATLDFGELGIITITGTDLGFSRSDFAGTPRDSLMVLENAPDVNGGSIDFTQLNKDKIGEIAMSKNVDEQNGGISIMWVSNPSAANEGHFEILADGKLLAQSENRRVDATGEVKFYSDVSDLNTSVGSITLTAATGSTLNANSFASYNIDTITTATPEAFSTGFTYAGYEEVNDFLIRKFDYQAGALEIPAQPDPPVDPDNPKPPVGPDQPNPPVNPDQPKPPVNPGDPDNPDQPGTSTRPKGGKGLILQIGDSSQQYDRLEVFLGDMHVTAMGTTAKDGSVTASIRDIRISSQLEAQQAIAVIKDAINYVSSIRGDLGAYQNRLDHTANNLSVMHENIQQAESLIRDTDVAEEMMAYTKNSILIQSAQAMLAQANQVPQGVLQLLR